MSRITIITNIPSPYRVDYFYYLQTNWIQDRVSVIYTSSNEDNRCWTVSEERIRNSDFLKSRVFKIPTGMDVRYLHLPSRIDKVLAAQAPDVVVAWEYNPAALQSLLWCRRHGVKFIHGTDGTLHSERNIGKFQKLARKVICANADACVASSTKAKEKLLAWGVPEERIFTSLLTEDVSRFQNLELSPVPGRLLYVGSMIPRKGLDLLIDSLRYVTHPFCLHIVGNGESDQIADLKRQAQAAGIEEKLVFRGFLEGRQLLDEYRHAGAFVLPTREDCFGLVLLEAACTGIPVVSSKYADGAYDVLEDATNGFIADPYRPEEFSAAVERALEAQPVPQEAKKRIERFSFESVSRGFRDALEYVMR